MCGNSVNHRQRSWITGAVLVLIIAGSILCLFRFHFLGQAAKVSGKLRQHIVWTRPMMPEKPDSVYSLGRGEMVRSRFKAGMYGRAINGAFYVVASDAVERELVVSVWAEKSGPDELVQVGSCNVVIRTPQVIKPGDAGYEVGFVSDTLGESLPLPFWGRYKGCYVYYYRAIGSRFTRMCRVPFSIKCQLAPKTRYWLMLEPVISEVLYWPKSNNSDEPYQHIMIAADDFDLQDPTGTKVLNVYREESASWLWPVTRKTDTWFYGPRIRAELRVVE